MKKLIIAAALFAGGMGAAHAKDPFHFGIALCEYAWHERSNTLLVGSKMNPQMPDAVWEQQEKYCNSKENIAKAMAAHDKYVNTPETVYKPQGDDSAIQRANDIYQACVLGASDDGRNYLRLVSRYSGNGRMLNILRKAHSYGYNVARTYRDCSNYVMGY